MEDLCKKVPFLCKSIFEELDNQSFVNFKDASREINDNLKNERFYWIRVLRTYNYLLGDFKETWAKVVKGIPAEYVKEIAFPLKSCLLKNPEIFHHYQNNMFWVVSS